MNDNNQRPAPAEFEEIEEKDMNVKEILFRYLRYWFLFPIFIGLALAAAYYYLQTTQPIYRASTTLLIKDEEKAGGPLQEMLSELGQVSAAKLLENEMEILKSATLMAQVAEQLQLGVRYEARDGLGIRDLYKESPVVVVPSVLTDYAYQEPLVIHMEDADHFRLNNESVVRTFDRTFRNDWGEFSVLRGTVSPFQTVKINFRPHAELAGQLLANLTISLPNPKSTVLRLSLDDPSSLRARDVLNKLLDVYVQSSLNDKNREASNTLKFIEDRLGLITGELSEVERDVESYKRTQGVTDIGTESKLFLENIQASDARLNEVNVQLRVLESIDTYIQSNNEGAVAPATYLISDPVLMSLLTRFNELQGQRERYARTTGASNPLLETVNTQLATTRQAIMENIQNLRRGLNLSLQNLQSVNQRFSAGLRSIPQKEREFVDIKRQQSIKESLYLFLLEKREETALAYASTVTDSRLIDAPSSSGVAISPRRQQVYLGAVAAGLILPTLLISLIYMLNNTVQNRQQIESLAQVSVLAEIGELRKKGNLPVPSIIPMASRSAVAEQFRSLRTNLQYLGDGHCRVVLCTSSIGNEGKSFVSTNLATSLAYADKRVVLVGLDLRKPSLHERLEVSNDKGVTNYLIGQSSAAQLIQISPVHKGLHVITSGPIPPNPSELLGNGRLPELLAALREDYDYIILDSPPYGLVTDAALISAYADATLYLVRYNYTLIDHLHNIRELHRSRRFRNLSVVYNGINYGGTYGGYGYGYGYGYYDTDAKSPKASWQKRVKSLVS
jgi:tyrosine-protein kinase Etk/Wzc